jgi:hypothetical protein
VPPESNLATGIVNPSSLATPPAEHSLPQATCAQQTTKLNTNCCHMYMIRMHKTERSRNYFLTHLRNPSANSQLRAQRNSLQPTQAQLPNHAWLKAKSGFKPLVVVSSKTPPDLQNKTKTSKNSLPTFALLVDLSHASPRCHPPCFFMFVSPLKPMNDVES